MRIRMKTSLKWKSESNSSGEWSEWLVLGYLDILGDISPPGPSLGYLDISGDISPLVPAGISP